MGAGDYFWMTTILPLRWCGARSASFAPLGGLALGDGHIALVGIFEAGPFFAQGWYSGVVWQSSSLCDRTLKFLSLVSLLNFDNMAVP